MKWGLLLQRVTERQLNEKTANRKLAEIRDIAIRNSRLGFAAKIARLKEPEFIPGQGYRYLVRMTISKHTYLSEEKVQEQYDTLYARLKNAAAARRWNLSEANVGTIDDGEGTTSSWQQPSGNTILSLPRLRDNNTGAPAPDVVADATNVLRPALIVPDLTKEVMDEYFSGIYERDAHLRIIHKAIKSYSTSKDKRQRSHVILYGLPASCKTTIFIQFKKWLESVNTGGDRMALLDATTVSKAGFEKYVLTHSQAGTLPDIIVCEEVEKHQPDNLLSLLAVMDARGIISRMNARMPATNGYKAEASAKVLIFATCNNKKLLRKFHKGALWSRFTHKIRCVRPSWALMERILDREVRAINGNPLWVKPALEFAQKLAISDPKNMDWGDPRVCIGFLDGKDALLDGSYQRDWQTILQEERKEVGANPEES